jgi:hypothetical protein
MTNNHNPLRGLGDLWESIPEVSREQYMLEGINWLTTTGFREFSTRYPDAAAWLQGLATKSTPLTMFVFTVIGSAASKITIKEKGSEFNSYLAHLLAAARWALANSRRRGGDGNSLRVTLVLQKAILALDPETSGPILEWLGSLDKEQEGRVYEFLAELSAEEIERWFLLAEPQRLRIAVLGTKKAEQLSTPSLSDKRESPLMRGLRSVEERLRHRREV